MQLHTKTAARALMIVVLAGIRLEAAEAPVKLRVLSGRPIVEDVFLNGSGPYRFLLDTGAQSNQVDAAIARKLNLSPAFRVDLETAGGVTRVAGGRINDVSVGSARATDQEFLFTNLDGIHTLSANINGVLGQEFLSHFNYRIDFRGKTLSFYPPDPSGIHMPIENVFGRPVVTTSLGRLVLDSGSDTLLLFHSAGRASGFAGIQTASGFAAVQTVSDVRLRIGGRDYRSAQTAVAPQPDRTEDGLMPASLFKAVYVSNSEHYVVLE